MKPIERHPVDSADLADLVAGERKLAEVGIRAMIDHSQPEPLSRNINNSLWIAGGVAVLEPGSDELCAALRAAAAKTAGLFKLMREMPGEYPIALGDGRTAILHNTGVNSHTHVGRWVQGFYASSIVRDNAALDELARTPVADLRRSQTGADECMFLWAETLQALRNGGDVGAKLQPALEATDPDRLKTGAYVLAIVVPEMQLLLRLLEGDAAAFNEALGFALKHHKKYWGSAKNKNDPEGYLALGPLAFASMAHDRGLAITVESDYLPRRLYEGGCRAG